MFRVLKYVLGASSLLVACLFWLAYLSPRPPLTIDSATLAGDGSQINYCELPILDGSGLTASDIPKANTPDQSNKSLYLKASFILSTPNLSFAHLI